MPQTALPMKSYSMSVVGAMTPAARARGSSAPLRLLAERGAAADAHGGFEHLIRGFSRRGLALSTRSMASARPFERRDRVGEQRRAMSVFTRMRAM